MLISGWSALTLSSFDLASAASLSILSLHGLSVWSSGIVVTPSLRDRCTLGHRNASTCFARAYLATGRDVNNRQVPPSNTNSSPAPVITASSSALRSLRPSTRWARPSSSFGPAKPASNHFRFIYGGRSRSLPDCPGPVAVSKPGLAELG